MPFEATVENSVVDCPILADKLDDVVRVVPQLFIAEVVADRFEAISLVNVDIVESDADNFMLADVVRALPQLFIAEVVSAIAEEVSLAIAVSLSNTGLIVRPELVVILFSSISCKSKFSEYPVITSVGLVPESLD